MDNAELVGGVLVGCNDPRAAAVELAGLLVAARPDAPAAVRAGLEPDLVDVLRNRLRGMDDSIPAPCQEAAAWVLGRRSVVFAQPWDLVATLPSGASPPAGLRRTTGETLVHLVASATQRLCLAAPFIDRTGLSFMGDALAAATARGVRLEILLPTRSTHADDALHDLTATIEADGSPDCYSVAALRADAPWAHPKVLTADSIAGDIGSANVTGAGIGGRNLELGVLVRGEQVAIVERVLHLYRQH